MRASANSCNQIMHESCDSCKRQRGTKARLGQHPLRQQQRALRAFHHTHARARAHTHTLTVPKEEDGFPPRVEALSKADWML